MGVEFIIKSNCVGYVSDETIEKNAAWAIEQVLEQKEKLKKDSREFKRCVDLEVERQLKEIKNGEHD